MSQRPNKHRKAYSVGQLADRWGVSPERVKRLVEAGKLPGAFTIPSAGRFGKALRVPAEAVVEAEAAWAAAGSGKQAEAVFQRKRADNGMALKHFPELADSLDAECPADGRY